MIDELTLAEDASRWGALGFRVSDDGYAQVGRVRLRFLGVGGGAGEAVSGRSDTVGSGTGGRGLVGWSLRGISSVELDGLPTTISADSSREPAPVHPNGVVAIDHVVAFTPAFERSVDVLQAAGLDLRRIREEPTPAGAPRQAFFRLGDEILELIQLPEERVARAGGSDGPARLWGLAFVVDDIERTVAELGEHVSEVRPAVQPGRRIATLRRSAGLSVSVALMSVAESAVGAR